ncbi:MAG: hypothetical protein COU27_03010 [Candidatus Levybacteria bacterium CG10_big_fil_rev_8_21_14_0_10_36_7]|nr:MAG: hypothetical protein COU27_03010 [Candidatus Levybacteria bacterium CG10_big_fil_rev_8_21_14_0_10_36_7]
MKVKNQRLMTFSESIDVTEAKGEHKYYLSFSRLYVADKKVLNVGSWTGPYEILIYDIAKDITSVDVEEKALKVLKKNLPKVHTVKAFSHRLPFSTETFDVITFFDVIEHIPVGYELASVLEMSRVLKKDGYLFLATPSKNFLSCLFDPAYLLAGHRHYTKAQLTGILEEAGFRIEAVERVGSFFSSFYALSFYFFKHILRMKMPTIKFVEEKMEKDIASEGYIQYAIRAKKI